MIRETEQSQDATEIAEPITQLLQQWTNGDKAALDKALPLLHQQLRQLAGLQLRNEGGHVTLSTTVLVNELYLELLATKQLQFENRYRFFSFVASVMRHLLVRHARRRNAAKRGAGFFLEGLEEERTKESKHLLETEDLLAISEALDTLEKMDPRQTRVIELSFFAGLTQEEIAEAMGLSRSTVKRDLRTANIWLSGHLRNVPVGEEASHESA